jgi:hypothetical protein
VAVIIILIFNTFLAFSPAAVSEVHAQEKYSYTYYGYVPAKIWLYNLTYPDKAPDPTSNPWRLNTANGTISKAALVMVVGMKDDTHVRISYLNGTLVSEKTIDNMQKDIAVFANDTFFKVETSELACVLLLNYGSVPKGNETDGPIPTTFCQSASGAYVGKEFIVMASASYAGIQYAIFALEKAEVTVTGEDGKQTNYTLEANTWKELLLYPPFHAYKVESTGNIMIQSGRVPDIYADWDNGYRTFFVPSVEGGFVGRTFYTWSTTSWDPGESYGFRVSATQNSKITVWALDTKEQILTANVQADSGFGFQPKAHAIVVQSDQPITLEYLHNGSLENTAGHQLGGAYGSGVGYIGVKPNQDTAFYLSMDSYAEAYVFASENDTEVKIDSLLRTINADSYYLLNLPGTHVINSNKKVIIETLNWPNTPPYQGLHYNGVQIPCIQTVDVVPNVKLTPLGGSFPIMYVIAGAMAAAIAIVAFLLMRGRSRK